MELSLARESLRREVWNLLRPQSLSTTRPSASRPLYRHALKSSRRHVHNSRSLWHHSAAKASTDEPPVYQPNHTPPNPRTRIPHLQTRTHQRPPISKTIAEPTLPPRNSHTDLRRSHEAWNRLEAYSKHTLNSPPARGNTRTDSMTMDEPPVGRPSLRSFAAQLLPPAASNPMGNQAAASAARGRFPGRFAGLDALADGPSPAQIWADQVKRSDMNLHLSPRTGRTVPVLDQHDPRQLPRSLRLFQALVLRDGVKRKEAKQKFHERPGLRRKRLTRQRWRRRFMKTFKTIVNRVRMLVKQGW